MKIEKLSENQLKITLAPEDLTTRGLALNELSYGSPKTKDLYNELMEQALREFGFENENGALVIEAIPTGKGNLVIFITKNDESDNLDTGFSEFSPDSPYDYDDEAQEGENEFVPLTELLNISDTKNKTAKTQNITSYKENPRIFIFNSLDAITEVSLQLKDVFTGSSSVYKNKRKGLYFLILENLQSDKDEFRKICNSVFEFSGYSKSNYATLSVITEHCEKIIGSDAINILSKI
ncbi:MAG: adaptor protein MecA [Catonella sp.]|uniref:adaptor protein MecA n=1 Tax=Catonella sp. TaxID=2382125 RepID=UPI003FA135FB